MLNGVNRRRLDSDAEGRTQVCNVWIDDVFSGHMETPSRVVNTVSYWEEMLDVQHSSQRVKPMEHLVYRHEGGRDLYIPKTDEPTHPLYWARWAVGADRFSVPFDEAFMKTHLMAPNFWGSPGEAFLFNSILNGCGVRAWKSFAQQIPKSYHHQEINRFAIMESIAESGEMIHTLASLPDNFKKIKKGIERIKDEGAKARANALLRRLSSANKRETTIKMTQELSSLCLKWQFDIAPNLELISTALSLSESVALAYKAIVESANETETMHYREFDPITSEAIPTVIGPANVPIGSWEVHYVPQRKEAVYSATCMRRWTYPSMPSQQQAYIDIGLALSDASNPLKLIWALSAGSFIKDWFVPVSDIASIANIPAIATSYLNIWDLSFSYTEDRYYNVFLKDWYNPSFSANLGQVFTRRKFRKIGCPFSNPGAIINGRIDPAMLSILALIQAPKYSKGLRRG